MVVLSQWCHFVFSPQIIAEGANGPTTPDADKIFLENNVMVIPVRKWTFFFTAKHDLDIRLFCASCFFWIAYAVFSHMPVRHIG